MEQPIGWIFSSGSGGLVAVSQQTFTSGTAPITGYEGTYFVRCNYTTSGTGTICLNKELKMCEYLQIKLLHFLGQKLEAEHLQFM
jgi:hypothetical protein